MQLKSRLKKNNLGALKKWCDKFLRRHLLTFRVRTRVGHKLSDSYLKKEFIQSLMKI